jgi:hypothetical protein
VDEGGRINDEKKNRKKNLQKLMNKKKKKKNHPKSKTSAHLRIFLVLL